MTNPVFIVAGEPRPRLQLEWEQPTDSVITGAPLRAVTVSTGTVEPALRDAVREDLGSSTITDDDGRSWAVTTWSEQIFDGRSSFMFSLKETETLQLHALTFGSVHLDTFQAHTIEATDGFLGLDIIVNVDPATSEQIEAAIEHADASERPYFPVTLAGVCEGPLSMRFGRCVWRQLDDGRVRHRLVFVSEAGDSAKTQDGLQLNYPEINRLKDSALNTQARLDALLGELSAGGALSPDAIERISSAKPAPRADRLFGRDDELGNRLDGD